MSNRGKHRFVWATRRWMPWQYCCKCGIVILRNAASEKAIKKPCDSDWDGE